MAVSSLISRVDRWLLTRLVALLASIATIAMLASLLPTLENDSTYYGDGMSAVFACLPFAGNAWTILYSGVCLAIILAGKSIHPGVDIAIDLLGWGLNWSMGIMLLIWVAEPYYVAQECDLKYSTVAKCATAKKVAGIQWTGGILTVLVGTAHLAFFIKACIDTHHRRISDERANFMKMGGVNRA